MSETDLLRLQRIDLHIDELRKARATSPKLAELATRLTDAARLKDEVDNAALIRDATQEQQEDTDSELKDVERRIESLKERLYGQATVSTKDAQAMTNELDHLSTRRSRLEDVELEILTRLDDLRRDFDLLIESAREAAARIADLRSRIEDESSDLDRRISALRTDREPFSSAIGPSLLDRYEGLRKRFGGIVVTRLEGRRCGGCHLELASAEVDRLHRDAVEGLSTCDECERLLVI